MLPLRLLLPFCLCLLPGLGWRCSTCPRHPTLRLCAIQMPLRVQHAKVVGVGMCSMRR